MPSLLREIKDRCKILAPIILAKNYATDDEVASYRPGGSENPERDGWAWARYLMNLGRFLGREEREVDSRQLADQHILDALRAEPREVRLTRLGADGQHVAVMVYPKSLDALLNCHARDSLLGWLAPRVELLRQSNVVEDLVLLERAVTELSYQYGLLVWAVCAPGPGLPFDPREEMPDLPQWVREVEPFDVVRIAHAFGVVNAQRLEALKVLTAPDRAEDSGKRPSWSIFIGSLAIETGESPTVLMRDRSLAELVAATRLSAEARRVPKEPKVEHEDTVVLGGAP